MATISGTIRGCSNVSKDFAGAGNASARAAREVWLLNVDFPAYTGSADTAVVTGVGAAIEAAARNEKSSRTVRWAAPALAGADANNQAVHFTGTAVQAATVSSDDITGQLSGANGTELTATSGVTRGVGIFVGVD